MVYLVMQFSLTFGAISLWDQQASGWWFIALGAVAALALHKLDRGMLK